MSEEWTEIKSDLSNLPKDRQKVLFVVKLGSGFRVIEKGIFLERHIDQHISTENIFHGDGQSFNNINTVSHWMDIPDLPLLEWFKEKICH